MSSKVFAFNYIDSNLDSSWLRLIVTTTQAKPQLTDPRSCLEHQKGELPDPRFSPRIALLRRATIPLIMKGDNTKN